MALKDQIELGMSLPHRAPEPVDMAAVDQVARRADALGFRDLWVTENTIDHVFSFDPFVALTWAAAVTKKIRVGVSVSILPVHDPIMMAHRVATLDYMSGGRALLGVGLGRDFHYATFGVAKETRVRRFREQLQLIKALWTGKPVDHRGEFYALEGAVMSPMPVQRPHVPIWFGGGHPNAIARAAELADAWMGAGGSSIEEFGKTVPILKAALAKAGRKVAGYPISKRVFLSVHDKPEVARAEVDRWYREVYHNPKGVDTSGVHGTPEQVRAQLETLVAMGATHLLLNPVARYAEQVEALAKLTGLA
ncbi:MAG TPA: LLM class flavin-dependent oxidoreductase [Candidatus Sulfotelmatobacter sp.]|nr:LLM class flavin-dependent oxidoreductase [Candidatus Sulfotelmatobacter sp.]